MHITMNQVLHVSTAVIAVCSFLHTFLPPWDWQPNFIRVGLAEFPLAQKIFYGAFHNRYYRLLIYIVGYIAINGRSTIWRFISVNNAEGPNASVPTVIHAANLKIEEQQNTETHV